MKTRELIKMLNQRTNPMFKVGEEVYMVDTDAGYFPQKFKLIVANAYKSNGRWFYDLKQNEDDKFPIMVGIEEKHLFNH